MPPAKTSDNEEQADWNATADPAERTAAIGSRCSRRRKFCSEISEENAVHRAYLPPFTIVADPRFTPL